MVYFYGNVEWIGDRRTKIKIKNYELEVDPPPQYKGPEGQLFPE